MNSYFLFILWYVDYFMPNNNKIKMYTDGACKGNPGIGGWCVYVLGENDEIYPVFKKLEY